MLSTVEFLDVRITVLVPVIEVTNDGWGGVVVDRCRDVTIGEESGAHHVHFLSTGAERAEMEYRRLTLGTT
jgi:hypothetical protein